MKFKTRFGTTYEVRSKLWFEFQLYTLPYAFYLLAHIEKMEGIGGYVIEILIIIQNVLCNVVPNLVFNFMGNFTTFVG